MNFTGLSSITIYNHNGKKVLGTRRMTAIEYKWDISRLESATCQSYRALAHLIANLQFITMYYNTLNLPPLVWVYL